MRVNLDIYIGRNNEVIEVEHTQHQNCDQRISKVGLVDYTDSITDADPHYDRKYSKIKGKDRIYELYSISSAEASYNERSHFSYKKSKSPEKSFEPGPKICPDEFNEDICKELNYTSSMYDRDLMRVIKTGNQKSTSTTFDGNTSEFLGNHDFQSEDISNESVPTQDPRVKRKYISKYQNFRMNLLSKKNKSFTQQAKFLLKMRQDVKENLGPKRFASSSVEGDCEAYGPEAQQFSSKLRKHPQA